MNPHHIKNLFRFLAYFKVTLFVCFMFMPQLSYDATENTEFSLSFVKRLIDLTAVSYFRSDVFVVENQRLTSLVMPPLISNTPSLI